MEQLSFDFYTVKDDESFETKYEKMLIEKFKEQKHVTPCELNGIYYWYHLFTPYAGVSLTQMNGVQAEIVDNLIKTGKLVSSGSLITGHTLYVYINK